MNFFTESQLKKLYEKNLNSLIVLFIILKTNSVSHGAKILGISQPAASRILDRLRQELNDPLIIRDGKSITATSKAKNLKAAIEALINHSCQIFENEKFDPLQIHRNINIAVNSHMQQELMPKLMHVFSIKAPKLKLIAQPIQQNGLEEKMRQGHIDLAIGLLTPNSMLRQQPIMSKPLICLAHTTLVEKLIGTGKMERKQFLELPHIDVHPAGMGQITKHLDKHLNIDKGERNVACIMSSFQATLDALKLGIHISVMPQNAYNPLQHPELSIIPLNFELPTYEASVWWHNASNYDPLILWLVNELKEIANH